MTAKISEAESYQPMKAGNGQLASHRQPGGWRHQWKLNGKAKSA
jgi:hypothetical protein